MKWKRLAPTSRQMMFYGRCRLHVEPTAYGFVWSVKIPDGAARQRGPMKTRILTSGQTNTMQAAKATAKQRAQRYCK